MTLLVVGINHKTAPIAIREKVSFSHEHLRTLLSELNAQTDISEAVVLSTCNRTEIYTDSTNIDAVTDVLLQNSTITLDELQDSLYAHKDFAAVEHIMRVACGLDSMVIGEQQILGQMKAAINEAAQIGSIQRNFHALFKRVFNLAKHVRTTTQIGACPVSVASIAVKLAQQYFGSLDGLRVLLLGSGDTIRLVANHLQNRGLTNLTIASRHIDNAKKLAHSLDGHGVALTDLAHHLPQADIIMSATASSLPIVGKGCIESALKSRPTQPYLLVDMAVPRDIEPEVKTLDNVFLYTIDDLRSTAQENMQFREHAAKQALNSIKEHAADYMQWLNSTESVDMIRAFRQHVDAIRQTEQAKAYKLLEQGTDPHAVIELFANNFSKKLMHNPSQHLREASEYGRTDVLHLVQELFAIKHNQQPEE